MYCSDVLNKIRSLEKAGIKPGLETVERLYAAADIYCDRLKLIHIAGTNGKGSVGSFIASVLSCSGFKTGRFSSPAVMDFFEKIQIDDENISQKDYCLLGERLLDLCEKKNIKPTIFEFETVLGLLYFTQNNCDYAVIEAGMGGALDATNIIRSPIVSVITKIGLDHMSFLGDSIEKIAKAKAGIIKPGSVVCSAFNEKEAADIIKRTAESFASPLKIVDNSAIKLKKCDIYGSVFDYKSFKDIEISLVGIHQAENAALALEAFDALKNKGCDLKGLKKGMKAAVNRGRMEVICSAPLFICDGAHNPQGAMALKNSIQYFFNDKKVIVILGVLKDKDFDGITREILPIAKCFITLTPKVARGLDGNVLCSLINSMGAEAFNALDAREAVDMAYGMAKKDDIILACGSLSYMKEVIEYGKSKQNT